MRADLKTLKLITNYQGRIVPTIGAAFCSAATGLIVFQAHGFRRAGSLAWTNEKFLTPRRFARRSRVQPKRFCRSYENIRHGKPLSEKLSEPTAGLCRRSRCAKPSSTLLSILIMLSGVHLFVSRCLTTALKSRIRDFCRSA